MFLPSSLMPSFPCHNYTFTTYLLYQCKKNCSILFYFLSHYKFCLILCTSIINIKLNIYVYSASVCLHVCVCVRVCCRCPFLCAHLAGKRPPGIFFIHQCLLAIRQGPPLILELKAYFWWPASSMVLPITASLGPDGDGITSACGHTTLFCFA